MSKYLKQYEKEHMKMAMLKQEQTFKQQVQELHRLYRVQKLLMIDAANNTMPHSVDRRPEEEPCHAQEDEAGSSKPWDACCSERERAPLLALEEGDLELTLAVGGFGAAEKAAAAAKKEASSSSVDSRRTSMSSSSTEFGSPGCRAMPAHPPSSQLGSSAVKLSPNVGQHLEQDGLKQPPWFHQCLNLAR